MKKVEWEQDLINRQRNIVFPDTVLNEGRFYRNIFSRDAHFTPGQRIGLVLFGFYVMGGSLGGMLDLAWSIDHGRKLTIVDLPAIVILTTFLLIGLGISIRGIFPPAPTRLTRLRSYRRPRIR